MGFTVRVISWQGDFKTALRQVDELAGISADGPQDIKLRITGYMSMFWVLKRFGFSGHIIADFAAFVNTAYNKQLLQKSLKVLPGPLPPCFALSNLLLTFPSLLETVSHLTY